MDCQAPPVEAQPAELVSVDIPEQQQAAEPAPNAQEGAAAVQRPAPPPSSSRRVALESPVIMLPGAGEQGRWLGSRRSTKLRFSFQPPARLCPASGAARTAWQPARSGVRRLARPGP